MGKYSDIVWDGKTLTVPEGLGKPGPHQLLGSNLDNLVELSGRACYDSLGVEKSRGSEDYHKHIIEVNHGSVQEHASITVKIIKSDWYEASVLEYLESVINHPGVYVDMTNLTLTANLRAIREWDNFSNGGGPWYGAALKNAAKTVAPLVMQDYEPIAIGWKAELVEPETVNSVWLSYYIHNVSRGLTHELVRHKYQTAISQRSTRYVDESGTDWSLHPLFYKYYNDSKQWDEWGNSKLAMAEHIEKDSKKAYDYYVDKLQSYLIEAGVDKFTARKQARGAARGLLGNALTTELIFSASLAQWIRMLKQRATQHADAEIRLLFNEIYLDLKDRYPSQFIGCSVTDCPDGIGFELVWPKGGAV